MKKASILRIIYLFLLLSAVLPYTTASSAEVEIKGRWLYVDGEKFFVKAIGYAAFRQHETPGVDSRVAHPELLKEDLRLIKEAGFNTIRLWAEAPREEVMAYNDEGLMVMYGFWFDQDRLEADEGYIDEVARQIKQSVERVKDCPNILMYLAIANEPKLTMVRDKGEDKLLALYKKLKEAVRQADPTKPVAMTYWSPLLFMEHDIWDVYCCNTYYHSPVTANFSLGYRAYNEYIAKKIARGKPYINTEFGIILGPKIYGGHDYLKYTYGGNTAQDQAGGYIELYEDLISAGATGVNVLYFLDQWWVVGNPEKQDAHPEEWLGIAALSPQKEGGHAVPREAYYALKGFNQALLIQPRDMQIIEDMLALEVYVTDNIARVTAEIEGLKLDLKKTSQHWFEEIVDLSAFRGRVVKINVLAEDAEGGRYSREAVVWVKGKRPLRPPVDISFSAYPDEVKAGRLINIKIQVETEDGGELENKEVYISMFSPLSWGEMIWTKKTDRRGVVEMQIKAPYEKGWVNIGAGTDFKLGEFEKRVGDIITVFID